MYFTFREEACVREKLKRDCVFQCVAILDVKLYYCDMSCGGKEV